MPTATTCLTTKEKSHSIQAQLTEQALRPKQMPVAEPAIGKGLLVVFDLTPQKTGMADMDWAL